MECPNCHTPITDNRAFCRKCGANISELTGRSPDDSNAGVRYASGNKPTPARTTGQGGQRAVPPYDPTIAAADAQTLGRLIHQLPNAQKPRVLDINYRMHCPFCNNIFHPADCAIYSGWGYDKNALDSAKLIKAAPQSAPERIWARTHVEDINGRERVQQNARRQCPRCANLLPRGLENDACFNIAVVGTNSSSKSHYIVSLLNQLEQGSSLDFNPNISVGFSERATSTNPSDRSPYKVAQEMLIKNKLVLPLTRRMRPTQDFTLYDPWIFHLEITYMQEQKPVISRMNLIFYDIAGEDITNEQTMMLMGWPIMEAQAIIHVVDPLGLPGIRDKLPPSPQVEAARNATNRASEYNVLSSIIRLREEFHQLNPRELIQTPVAIMLAKSDLLDPIAEQHGFAKARFMSRGTHDGSINDEDLRAVDYHMRNFLKQMQELRLLNASGRLARVGFFAASATGCSPNQGRYPEINPRRCLDPLFWILGQLTEQNTPRK
jgi:hypothetical protein